MTFAFRLFIQRRERKGGTSNEQITVNELKISRLTKFSCEQPPVRPGAVDEQQAEAFRKKLVLGGALQ